MTTAKRTGGILRRAFLFLAVLGPGLITASADNDASGIATYSMAGSTYGYAFLWLILWVTFGEVVVQEMAARMGAVTGRGLTDLIREQFGAKTTLWLMLGLAVANFGTATAQFAGIAAAGELLGVSRYIVVPLAAAAIWFLVLRGSYVRVEKALLVLCLYALAYVVSAFLVRPPWGEVLKQTLVPTFRLERGYVLALLATVGTTMTPWGCAYLQASVADKGVGSEDYALTRLDVISGAVLGNIVSAFVVICTAATLFVRGIRVETAEQAALSLVPLAGNWAKVLFAGGLLGASLLAAMVLPLATAYAVCGVFGWERGLRHPYRDARAFYRLYGGQIVLGSLIVLIPGIPLFPLMWLTQVSNAVLLPVTMVLMLRLANNPALMHNWKNSRLTNVLAIGLSVLVTLATVALFF